MGFLFVVGGRVCLFFRFVAVSLEVYLVWFLVGVGFVLDFG